MNNIKVPDAYKSQLRGEKTSTEDYKPAIRAYIENRPGVVLFRRWLALKHKEVEDQREELLK